MSRKLNSTRILLEEPYISTSVIQQVLGTSHEIAKLVFKSCKEVELSKAPVIGGEPLDIRPFKVSTKVFLKVTATDYSFVKKQYLLKKERLEYGSTQ